MILKKVAASLMSYQFKFVLDKGLYRNVYGWKVPKKSYLDRELKFSYSVEKLQGGASPHAFSYLEANIYSEVKLQ